jgi:hypothetical protein
MKISHSGQVDILDAGRFDVKAVQIQAVTMQRMMINGAGLCGQWKTNAIIEGGAQPSLANSSRGLAMQRYAPVPKRINVSQP